MPVLKRHSLRTIKLGNTQQIFHLAVHKIMANISIACRSEHAVAGHIRHMDGQVHKTDKWTYKCGLKL